MRRQAAANAEPEELRVEPQGLTSFAGLFWIGGLSKSRDVRMDSGYRVTI
jgi:hypothetical protein